MDVLGLEVLESLQVVNSANWAGAVQLSPPSGTCTSVSGQWTLPTVFPPPSVTGEVTWYSSEWVGIDGASCTQAILQAGTYSTVQVSSSGAMTTGAAAWYEWYPNAMIEFTDFSVSAGDKVQVSITATSSSEGVVVMNNFNTGYSSSITLTAPSSSTQLCGTNAEWILEDFSSDGLVPFSSFTNVNFQNCEASTTTGPTVDLTGATLFNIVQNNTQVATAATLNAAELELLRSAMADNLETDNYDVLE